MYSGLRENEGRTPYDTTVRTYRSYARTYNACTYVQLQKKVELLATTFFSTLFLSLLARKTLWLTNRAAERSPQEWLTFDAAAPPAALPSQAFTTGLPGVCSAAKTSQLQSKIASAVWVAPSASAPQKFPPACSAPAEPWQCSLEASTATSSASSAGGNRTICSATCMSPPAR